MSWIKDSLIWVIIGVHSALYLMFDAYAQWSKEDWSLSNGLVYCLAVYALIEIRLLRGKK